MMIIEQIYTGCLAQGAYYIESKGEAAVIDPLREVGPYIERAKRHGATIKYVFETHFHADFVSGHLDLSKKTGAPIIYGPEANPDFPCVIARDGQEFILGEVTFRVLHTPGHTLESSCYLLVDPDGEPQCIFTGDTLFIGDVGRPDLAQKQGRLTKEDLAGMLYTSLRSKILTLPDHVIVYPAHGAGSACGKNMGKETSDTLGHQRKTNYALQPISKDDFVAQVTEGLLPPPAYFPKNVALNKGGYESLDRVLEKGLKPLTPAGLETLVQEESALVLDTRPAQTFKDGFIPRSINIGLQGDFAPWVGTLIPDIMQPIVVVCEVGKEEETVVRLSRVGYDNCLGYLDGGIDAWKKAGREIDTIESISAREFKRRHEEGKLNVVDVRKPVEYESEHVVDAVNAPLDTINEHLHVLHEPSYIHCAGGYRSMIASSILKSRGYHNIVEVAGGFAEIKKSGVATADI